MYSGENISSPADLIIREPLLELQSERAIAIINFWQHNAQILQRRYHDSSLDFPGV